MKRLANAIKPSTGRKRMTRVDIVNPEFCDKILDRLKLEDTYKNVNLIEMNPGIGVLTKSLHDRLQPRSHLLLEPQQIYHTTLKKLTESHKNMQLVEMSGHDWDTYTKIFEADTFPSPPFPAGFTPTKLRSFPIENGINPDILFIGNLAHEKSGRRLVSQFLQTCALGGWMQHYGRVRFLLWMLDEDKERLLPYVVQGRSRPSAVVDTTCQLTEVVGTGTVRTGKGFQSIKPKLGPAKRQLLKSESKRQKIQNLCDKVTSWHNAIKNGHTRYKNEKILQKASDWEKKAKVAMREYLAVRNEELWVEGSNGTYADLDYHTIKKMWDDSAIPSPAKPSENEIIPQHELDFKEFEEDYLTSTTVERGKLNSIFDENFARELDPPLLQSWRDYNANPIIINPQKDVFPNRSLALLDFQPYLIHEYFRDPDPFIRTQRWKTYDWIVRSFFALRAQNLRMCLKSLAPGAEAILADLPSGDGKAMGAKRVRVLTIEQLIEISKCWDAWPFKPEDVEWSGFRKEIKEIIHD